MTGMDDHFCPGCGKVQRAFARYPWYFCQDCLATAEDGPGRRLVFGNASLSGGLVWGFADDPSRYDDRAILVICLIRKRRVVVHEARFGGVVAEPFNSAVLPPSDAKHHVDLSRSQHDPAVPARLKQAGSKT
ncbi:MAG: hypothetical protein RIB55_19960 [Nitratireductor sp.]